MAHANGFISLVVAVICMISFQVAANPIEGLCPDNRPKHWPSNWGKWGPNDEIGTLNYITPEVIRAASKLIRSGKIISRHEAKQTLAATCKYLGLV